MNDLFASPADLESAFAEGLSRMLRGHEGLGVHILVLANAAYDPALWARLKTDLAARHELLAGRVTEALRRGDRIDEPEDDLMVFLKLMALGFEHIQTTRHRRAGPWRLAYNPVRALRPPRMSGARMEGMRRPFDPAGFHFNKRFLEKEVLWRGELAGKAATMLYNKFPFARLHGLLVPQPERESPQFLTPELHGWAWEATAALGANLPGLALAYNSQGAHASVNHLHFQSLLMDEVLPALDPAFRHNGGAADYPLECLTFRDAEESWFFLDDLHARAQPYNLIHTPGALHVLPRAPQGARAGAPWNTGFAWSELAGAFTLFTRETFEFLGEEEIRRELAHHAP